jgi:hypothetical protein
MRLERVARELEKSDPIRSGPLSLRAVLEQRHSNGRFAAPHTVHQLLDGVADVATAASPEAPLAVSKNTWDAKRVALGRHDLPSANTIRRRIGLDWSEVLELAFTEPAKRSRWLAPRLKRAQFAGGDETICSGLRLIAHRLGTPLDRLSYDLEIAKVDAERVRRGRAPLNLPHSDTVIKRLRSWAGACELAGVEPARRKPPPHHRARPAVELLDEFISARGLLPYRNWFERWCRANDIPLGRDARRWDELVAAVRERRTARGEQTPAEPATRAELPTLPDKAGVGRARDRRVKRRSREDALASLRRYKERHLEPGQGPRQKHYMAAARKDRQLLAASTLERQGHFQDLCREAGI